MPVRKLVNPRKKRLSLRNRRRDGKGRLLPKKHNRRRATGRASHPKARSRRSYTLKPRKKVNRARKYKVRSRSKHNPHLVLMGLNPIKGGSHHMRRLKKKKNPSRKRRARYSLKARTRHNPRRRRYSLRRGTIHNPFGGKWSELIEISLAATAGGVAARTIPQALAPNQNQGVKGYAMNIAAGGALAWLGGKVRPNIGKGIAIGTIVMVGARVISDYFGKTLVTFGLMDNAGAATGTAAVTAPAQATTQLSAGDLAFDLRGYKASYFPLPMTSNKDLTSTKPWQGDIASLQAQLATKGRGGITPGPAANATSTKGSRSGRYGSVM